MLSTEQIALRDSVHVFSQECIAPGAGERDRKGEFPSDVQQMLAAWGLYGIRTPREYGGLGLDTVHAVLALEEIAYADGAIATSVAAHNFLCSGMIFLAGTQAQRKQFLPRLASGSCVGAWALTERGAGSDAGGVQTRAVRDGDSWVINGEKMFITHGSVAGLYVVLALTDPEAGKRGITAFIVERETPGLLP